MQINGRHIIVMGLGRSGLAATRFLIRRGARVTVNDAAAAATLADAAQTARGLGAQVALGGHPAECFADADLIVVSPGVPHTLAVLEAARQRGIAVIGEVELASRFIAEPIIAVTGTNGKTTTCELLGHMLSTAGIDAFVGGNIGNPLIAYADAVEKAQVVVAEISSFQLDTIAGFHPWVAVLLNVTVDHLDRYPDMAAYTAAKGRLFENQTAADTAIFNVADPRSASLAAGTAARLLAYGPKAVVARSGHPGAVITPDTIVFRSPEYRDQRLDLRDLALMGPHNRENVAAAALAALTAGAELAAIQNAVQTFKGPAHRMESVRTLNGIHFINDSKATNMDAVLRALACFDAPVVLIMGGRDKGSDFTAMAQAVRRHVSHLVVLGEAAEAIIAALGEAPQQGVHQAADMTDAVTQAYALAGSGETVLLSPACASFDMFTSYAQRGETFRRLVEAL
jgi:UDP-N-acetylmuramoylalanine--D-glutamate ligase